MSEKNIENETGWYEKVGHMLMDVAYYKVFITAWINTRMERDKSIFILSLVGLVLLTMAQVSNLMAWWTIAVLFATSIILVLTMYGQNSNYIEKLIQDEDGPGSSMEKMDVALRLMGRVSFFAAVAGWALLLFFWDAR